MSTSKQSYQHSFLLWAVVATVMSCGVPSELPSLATAEQGHSASQALPSAEDFHELGSAAMASLDGPLPLSTLLAICGNGKIEGAEECDNNGPCCSTSCQLLKGTRCRATDGACVDWSECDGTSAACPLKIKPAGTGCRDPMGDCDKAELCDGINVDCPADEKLPTGTVCRRAADVCDVAEVCTGGSDSCPIDRFADPSQICAGAGGHVKQYCSGLSPGCDGRTEPARCPNPVAVTPGCWGPYAMRFSVNSRYATTDFSFRLLSWLQGMIRAQSTAIGSDEKFVLCYDGLTYTIQAVASGMWLNAEVNYAGTDTGTVRAQPAKGGLKGQFFLCSNSDGSYSWQSAANGLYLTAEIRDLLHYGRLRARASEVDKWERFDLIPVP